MVNTVSMALPNCWLLVVECEDCCFKLLVVECDDGCFERLVVECDDGCFTLLAGECDDGWNDWEWRRPL